MHKKFLFSFVKKTAFWGIMGFLLLTSPAGLAQSSGASIFGNALDALYRTFLNVRTIVYVTAGFGLIGVAVAAISGKLPWRWLAMIAVALFTLAVAEKIVLWATDPNLGSTPNSDFASEMGNSEFKIYTGGSDSFDSIRNQNTTNSDFENNLRQLQLN